jgi:hypothetical protein
MNICDEIRATFFYEKGHSGCMGFAMDLSLFAEIASAGHTSGGSAERSTSCLLSRGD